MVSSCLYAVQNVAPIQTREAQLMCRVFKVYSCAQPTDTAGGAQTISLANFACISRSLHPMMHLLAPSVHADRLATALP